MSGSISAPFIRYPIGTSLLMAASSLSALSPILLPVAPAAESTSAIQVSAQLPFGAAETMASSVAQPAGAAAAQIPGVAQMTSTSYLGTAAITIQSISPIDGAANDVQAAINAASGQLPKSLLAADLPQGQPGGLAGPLAVGDLGNAAADW